MSMFKHGMMGTCAALLLACGGSSADAPDEPVREAWSEAAPETTGRSEGLTANTMGFEVDGIPVVLKQTPGSPIVATQIVVAGGVHDDTPGSDGLETITLRVLEHGGPTDMTKTAYAQQLAAVGSSIGASSGYDYAVLSAASIVPALDETWELFARTLRTPAFREADLELVRERQLQSIRTRFDSPDAAMGELLKEQYYAGHPYAFRPDGVEETVASFTIADLEATHARLMTRDRLRVIVVGDVSVDRVTDWVRSTLGDLPEGDGEVPPATGTPFPSVELAPVIEHRDGLPTTYILGYFDAPSPESPDFAALQLGLEVLSDRLFEEVRTRRNLTYAVASGIAQRGANTGYLYVTATDPETTVGVMLDTVAGMTVDGGISEDDLNDQIEMYLTRYWSGLQQNGQQASTLARWWMIGGGWQQADAHADRLRALTPADVQAAMTTYVRDIRWALVGDRSEETYEPPSIPPSEPSMEAPAPAPL